MENRNKTALVLALSAVPALSFSLNVPDGVIMAFATVVTFLLSGALSYGVSTLTSEDARPYVRLIINAVVVSGMMMIMEAFLYTRFTPYITYFALNAVSAVIVTGLDESRRSFKETMKEIFVFSDKFVSAVILTSLIREVFGKGSIFGFDIAFMKNYVIAPLSKTTGGLFVYAVVMALLISVEGAKEEKK